MSEAIVGIVVAAVAACGVALFTYLKSNAKVTDTKVDDWMFKLLDSIDKDRLTTVITSMVEATDNPYDNQVVKAIIKEADKK